ncbi:MAG: nicotinamide-nucleotide amidohydrolase family protein [Burkholderiales bacterium]|nr:MAG: nicotinamide-nucleotide amidohydrolase family protein [Burkholderiales bacterium]
MTAPEPWPEVPSVLPQPGAGAERLETLVVDAAAGLGRLLQARGWTVVTAESCTGGAIARALTETAGSSAWFDRGLVTYSNAAKQELLGVRASTLQSHGAVSGETVTEMVLGALGGARDRLALAVTGVAGPDGGSPDKPVGTVWFGWALAGRVPLVRMHRVPGDRRQVRLRSALLALEQACALVTACPPSDGINRPKD